MTRETDRSEAVAALREPKFSHADSYGEADMAIEQLARAIHNGRITVTKHGRFTERCICNALAEDILRGAAKLIPPPNIEKIVAEYAPPLRPEREEAGLRAALDDLQTDLEALWPVKHDRQSWINEVAVLVQRVMNAASKGTTDD